MAKPKTYMIQVTDTKIEPLIKQLASEDLRSIGNEVAWLIRKEYAIRHPETSNNPITYSISDKNAHSNKLP